MSLLLLFFLLAFPTIIFLLFNHRKNNQFNPPPGPKGLPFIGHLFQFDASEPHIYLSKLAKIYGPILSLQFGRVPIVVVQSAKIAKEVMKEQDLNFCSRPPMVGQQKLVYNGLDIAFAPYNAYLKEMKKLSMVHLFSPKRVQSSSPIRRDETSRLINKISSLASASKVVNLSELLLVLANSTICRIAFGKRYEDEGIERSRFHNIMQEVQAVAIAFYFSDYFPYIGWIVDRISGLTSRLDRVCKQLDEFYDEIIKEHIQHPKSANEQQDILDVLLQLQKEQNFIFELTVDHIKGVLMDILVGGTDTTPSMIVWAMTELIKNPMTMRKVQKELRSVIQGKTFVEEEDIPKLEYFKAVIKETFRLHPALPLLVPRQTRQQCSVEGYDIQPNTIVYVNAWAIGRDPESWDDPETFLPERFLGNKSSMDVKGQHFELIPFGAGRRMCPGMFIGLAGFELALANLLYAFDWELPAGMKKEDIDTDVIPGVVMHKKNHLCLVATKRF